MNTQQRSCGTARWLLGTAACLGGMPAMAVELISVDSNEAQGNFQSRYPTLSTNGRFVAFESDATNLVASDSNGSTDIFIRDRLLGTTVRISNRSNGSQSNAASQRPSISGDGSRIVFGSFGALLPESRYFNCYFLNRTSQLLDIVDRRTGTGDPSTEACQTPTINHDGTRVAFGSRSDALVAAGLDTNLRADVFIRNMTSGTTTRVNLGPGGTQANFDVVEARISGSGAQVVYSTAASNLVPGDTNGVLDVFMSTQTGVTTRISVGPGNAQPIEASRQTAAINHDGTILAFVDNNSQNLPDPAPAVESVVYLRIPASDRTIGMSLPIAGGLVREGVSDEPDLSADGRYLVFQSSDELLPGLDGIGGVYVIDLQENLIDIVSIGTEGDPAAGNAFMPRISANGSGIVWFSNATNQVPNDTNGTWDVFYAPNPLLDDVIFADDFE